MLWLGDYVILSDANMQRKIWGQSKNQRKILRKMQVSPFFSTLIWLKKNTSQKRGIAKDFFKFFHTGILGHVIGLVLLSNNFNFCWLAIVSKPEEDLRY